MFQNSFKFFPQLSSKANQEPLCSQSPAAQSFLLGFSDFFNQTMKKLLIVTVLKQHGLHNKDTVTVKYMKDLKLNCI